MTTIFQWEQDGHGGDHGRAVYFVGSAHEVSLRIETFAKAHELSNAIEARMKEVRRNARSALLAQIGRIEP